MLIIDFNCIPAEQEWYAGVLRHSLMQWPMQRLKMQEACSDPWYEFMHRDWKQKPTFIWVM